MAHNNYYTYKESPINGDILMNVQVFDIITKQVVLEDKDVNLDDSKGFTIPGTKAVIGCSIKDNVVTITIHVRVKYGVNVTAKVKDIQNKIATAIKNMTNVDVSNIDIIVDNIDFE